MSSTHQAVLTWGWPSCCGMNPTYQSSIWDLPSSAPPDWQINHAMWIVQAKLGARLPFTLEYLAKMYPLTGGCLRHLICRPSYAAFLTKLKNALAQLSEARLQVSPSLRPFSVVLPCLTSTMLQCRHSGTLLKFNKIMNAWRCQARDKIPH